MMTASDRGASHPNPAFDYLTGFVPRKLKDLFKWCDFLSVDSAHIYAALKKFGELVITDIEYSTSNDGLRRQYKRLFEKTLKIKGALLVASLDKHIYGNHFTSFYQPFVRYLKCPSCEFLINIQHTDYQFTLKKLEFRYRCKRCGKESAGKVVDRKIVDAHRLHIIRWDPKLIDIDYSPITGQSTYYYTIPEEIKEKVKRGAKHLINTMPKEFLEAIRDNKLFEFGKDAIFHVKVPSPSGFDQAWGFPPLTATMKLHLYTKILRKANEAIAQDHILPMRVMHPAATTGMDPLQSISMARWQSELKGNIKRWRRDPLHMMFAPISVGVTNVGGDGRAMLTLGEVQEADKSIMAALGIPVEFLYGGLTKTGMEGTLRLIENQLQNHADDMNDLLQWYTDKAAKFLGWERLDTKLTPLRMVDDTENKNLILNMATGAAGAQVISMTTVLDKLGIDLEDERRKRLQEVIDEQKFQQEVKREVDKMQNTLAQQVQQAVSGAAGLNYDQQAVIAKADETVQQLSMLDDGARKSALHDLQVTDYVMYATVIQRLEEYENSMAHQQGEAANTIGATSAPAA